MAQHLFNKHYDNVSAIFYLDHSNGQYQYRDDGV